MASGRNKAFGLFKVLSIAVLGGYAVYLTTSPEDSDSSKISDEMLPSWWNEVAFPEIRGATNEERWNNLREKYLSDRWRSVAKGVAMLEKMNVGSDRVEMMLLFAQILAEGGEWNVAYKVTSRTLEFIPLVSDSKLFLQRALHLAVATAENAGLIEEARRHLVFLSEDDSIPAGTRSRASVQLAAFDRAHSNEGVVRLKSADGGEVDFAIKDFSRPARPSMATPQKVTLPGWPLRFEINFSRWTSIAIPDPSPLGELSFENEFEKIKWTMDFRRFEDAGAVPRCASSAAAIMNDVYAGFISSIELSSTEYETIVYKVERLGFMLFVRSHTTGIAGMGGNETVAAYLLPYVPGGFQILVRGPAKVDGSGSASNAERFARELVACAEPMKYKFPALREGW
ncbi:MAG: hypothetical protein NUW37_07675 [Planctomycetes bacterium]|nr:hypothetical protein [Planctomycetota bacterium]